MDTKQVIVVRKDLNMRKGKLAAQVAHASMSFITRNLRRRNRLQHFLVQLSSIEEAWLEDSFAKIVVSVDSEEELQALVLKARQALVTVHEVIDSGRTEFGGVPTLTCAAFGPDEPENLDRITGDLKLL